MIFLELDQIESNPYQTRANPDADYIAGLAASIVEHAAYRPATRGLLQIPPARLVDADGQTITGRVTTVNRAQLAFGHNRLAAFRLIASGEIDFGLDEEARAQYERFPVERVPFNDAEMATSAWTENYQRRDLTAIEEARAIERALTAFGWSRDELGAKWSLSAPTISNKLRLLQLPDEVQSHISSKAITERQAIALVPLYKLPERPLEHSGSFYSPDSIVKLAQEGRSSDYLRERVDSAIEYRTRDLSKAKFPLDDAITGAENLPVCNDCPSRINHKRISRCADTECYDKKLAALLQAMLNQASADLRLPICAKGESSLYGKIQAFHLDDDALVAASILEAHLTGERAACENLKISSASEPWQQGGHHLDEYGYPDLRIVCAHGLGNHCTCLSKAKATDTREKNNNDETRAQQREKQRVRDELINPAVAAVATAILEDQPGAWLQILRALSTMYHNRGDDWNLNKIVDKIAFKILEDNWRWDDANYGKVRQRLQDKFARMDLPIPWDQATRLEQVGAQLGKIVAYITADEWTNENPIPQPAVRGNIENLLSLADEVAAINTDEEPSGAQTLQDISARIQDYITALRGMEETQ